MEKTVNRTASVPNTTDSPHSEMSTDAETDVEKRLDSNAGTVDTQQSSAAPVAPEKAIAPPPLDWDGPDDPENPFNWSLSKRVFHTLLTGLLSFSVTFGSSIFTPGYPDVAEHFGVSGTAALLGLSLFTLAIGVGPVIAAPISETLGRRPVYWISGPIFMLFTLGAGYSQTFAQLLVCRFFAGMFGSPVLAVGSGTNADIWPIEKRAVSIAIFLMAPFLGPALGPFIGGYAVMGEHGNWRWTQWVLLMCSLGVYLPSLLMSETYKKIILQKRAKRRGHAIPAPPGGPSRAAMIKMLFTITLFRPVHMLFTEPIVAFFSIYIAFSFAVLFAFFAAFPIVFEGVYGFNTGQTGLTFLAVGLGVVIAAGLGIVTDRKMYQKRWQAARAEGKENIAPEHRLYAAMIGSFGLPVGLFWFAWTARTSVHWISPVLAAIPFAIGNLTIFTSAALYTIDVYGPLSGASAVAANGLMRYTFGAAFPLFTVQMYDGLGIGWATSIFGFISLGLLPIPWVLYRYGPKIRARSGYPTVKF